MYSLILKRRQAKPRKTAVIRKSINIAIAVELGSNRNIKKENLPLGGEGSRDLR
jgi:hypothetical protein